MAAVTVIPPYFNFRNDDGTTLNNGYVYIGTAGLDPATNPITVYWDSALTIPAAQPIRTINGYYSNAGTPDDIFVNADDFSITVLDSTSALVFTKLNYNLLLPFNTYLFKNDELTGANERTIKEKLKDIVSIQDFGAVGDGITDDTAAFTEAEAETDQFIYVPDGLHIVSGLTLTKRYWGPGTVEVDDVIQVRSSLGGLRLGNRYNNSTETLGVTSMEKVTCSTLSGSITKTLPASSTLANGTIVGFKFVSGAGNFLTVTANGSDTINWGFGGLSNTFRMASVGDLIVLQLDKTGGYWEVIIDRMEGPFFTASRQNSSQSIGNNVFTKCNFNTEVVDSHGNYDPTTNFRFTPEIEGYFSVQTKAHISPSAAGRVAVALYVNGSLYEYGNRPYQNTDGVVEGNWEAYLNGSTDYLEIFAISIDASATFASAASINSIFKARRRKK